MENDATVLSAVTEPNAFFLAAIIESSDDAITIVLAGRIMGKA